VQKAALLCSFTAENTGSKDGRHVMSGRSIDRRTFLKTTAAGALAFPMVVRSSALGGSGYVAPSERVTMGFIGVGGMGTSNMRAFLAQPDV
jgi:hypothetical protein